MSNLELITEGMKRLNDNQDAMLDKLNAIHIQTTQTNGRVTAVEKETAMIWKVLKPCCIVLAVIVLVMIARGILKIEQIPFIN